MFKFKLEALLNHRRYQEEVLQKDLAASKKELMDEQVKLRKQKDAKRQCVRDLNQKQQSSKSAADILSYFLYLDRLSEEINRQQKRVISAEQRFIAVRSDLIAAMKKRKTLEKLKENHHRTYQLEIQRNERSLMDEIAINRHIRSH